MSYGKNFSFGPAPLLPPKDAERDVLRDVLLSVLTKSGPLMRYMNPLANRGAAQATPKQVPYTHRFIQPSGGWPSITLPTPPLDPVNPMENVPGILAPQIPEDGTKSPVSLPAGFFPPTIPTQKPLDTNVTPRPALSPIPDAPTRNRRGEGREAAKGAGIAALIGLLAGGGRGAVAAATGYGQGANVAADEDFAQAMEAWKQRAAQTERADQNRQVGWQNEEAGRQARNEGILDANRNAQTTYGLERDAYDRGQVASRQRRQDAELARRNAESEKDRDLDRSLKQDELDRRKKADVEAEKYKRTPEQVEAEKRAGRAMAGLANATTIEERQYWGGVLAAAESALGYKVAPPPARGGKLVPTAAQQANIDQGNRRIDIQAERNSIARARGSVSRSAAEARKTGDTAKVLQGIEGKIYQAKVRLSTLMPKSTIRMVDDGNGNKVPLSMEPTDAEMANYNAIKAETEQYITYLESEAASLRNATRPRQPDTKSYTQRMYETGTAGVAVPRGGTAPVVVDKPLTGFVNGRRTVTPPLPPNTTTDRNGYMVDNRRSSPQRPTPRPTPARSGSGNRGKEDLSKLSDEELLKRMAGGKK